MAFPPPPKPKSILDYHRVLSPTAGIRVSPLCLGAMNFGDAWKGWMGECNKETVFEILDYFYEKGGNFIDTANNYQNEQSEAWIGEWMEMRGVRDQIVLATKFSCPYRSGSDPKAIQSNYTGNHTKSLAVSLAASLKKLRTTYVDVLYLHWWDFTTSIEEIMKSLDALADQGKILYLGVSDTPAWIVSKANQYARDHGMRQFVVYQGKWSAADRDFEREIIPMCRGEGLALAPWANIVFGHLLTKRQGALGGGFFKTEEQRKSQEGRNFGPMAVSEVHLKVSAVLEKVAKQKETIMTSVALAYVMHKTPNVFPIIGGRKIQHLKGNIEALSLKLSPEEIEEIENAYPFDYGFPLNFLFMGQKVPSQKGSDVFLIKMAHCLDVNDPPKPIEPRSLS
ncbi:Norsolorinic acid reductase A [Pseudocercospora fuligena]|uniref:Norsolorinic acid reductase A n=1 Tax=Pseudocercospora fuligena TaxID=685502 RepID=A0A8H6VPF7_9PEZI|nr:Norsolorinic acid reductase A [Pseudocercospora fuligena]